MKIPLFLLRPCMQVTLCVALFGLTISFSFGNNESDKTLYTSRVSKLQNTSGLVAFWDFVKREDSDNLQGNFVSISNLDTNSISYVLHPFNMSREFWNEGPEATLLDFPLLGNGPFGQAIRIERTDDETMLPYLAVKRRDFHGTSLDIKGPGQSVSLMVWVAYEKGNHALAGIWHEGTDTREETEQATIITKGERQYGMFAGLGVNPGGVAAHVSENGVASFGSIYAHNLALTPEVMPKPTSNSEEPIWSVAAMVFDNEKNTITAYLNGKATENWIEEPNQRWFFRQHVNAWICGKAATVDDFVVPEGFDLLMVPKNQHYLPPEEIPIKEVIEFDSPAKQTLLSVYEFTKVRTTYTKNDDTQELYETSRELVALKVNPYWFPHDIYEPSSLESGGPFTIGRVIHSNRTSSVTGYIGGVAVFNRALVPQEIYQLSQIGMNEAEHSSNRKIILLTNISEE